MPAKDVKTDALLDAAKKEIEAQKLREQLWADRVTGG
jgi:hypothetical protein